MKVRTMSSSDSSAGSSFFSSLGASAATASVVDAAGAAEPAAPPPPPEPTFDNISFTFFPSRTWARSFAQIESISTLAALVRVIILSDWNQNKK